MEQFLQTTVIGRFRTDFRIGHYLLSIDMECITEMIVVPQLKKPHIKADVGRVQPIILGKLKKDSVQVHYIVHDKIIKNRNPPYFSS